MASTPTSPTMEPVNLPDETIGGSADLTYESSTSDDENGSCDDDAVSEASSTSTIRHNQEPFDSFQNKVAQLASLLFPSVNPSDIEISRMKGGTYNRVVGLTINEPLYKKYSWKWLVAEVLAIFFHKDRPRVEKKYILRIPRINTHSMDFDVVTLELVAKHLSVPIPQTISYDLSQNNILGESYMLQPRLPGQNLTFIYDSLTLAQKKSVVRQLTQIVMDLAKITSDAAGRPSRYSTSFECELEIEKFEVPRRGKKGTGFEKPRTWVAQKQTPLEFLLEQCERWREFQAATTGANFEDIWDNLAKIARGLEERGFLEPAGFCLSHGDLQAYNILVDVRDEENVDITAVLDWDSAAFAPSFLAYKSLFWTWLSAEASSEELDDEDNADREPETEEGRQIKEVFMQTASPEYLKYAFAPEAIIARKMFEILRDGFFSSWEYDTVQSIITEWDELNKDSDDESEAGSDSESDSDANQNEEDD